MLAQLGWVELFMSKRLMSNQKSGLMSTSFEGGINVEIGKEDLCRQKRARIFRSNSYIAFNVDKKVVKD